VAYVFSENVANTDYERVMREYAEGGQQLVVGEAFAVERAARAVAKDYPKTAFLMGSSFGPSQPNFAVFDNWIHEPAYLTGMVAGRATKSNVIGMVGGFLTPVLVGAADPNPAVLFSYLTALSVGLFVVIRREKWWWLAWPIVIACYAWVLIWLAGNGAPGDSVWVGLFLIAVCAIRMGFMSPEKDGTERAPFAWAGLLATAGVAVAFMTFVVIRGEGPVGGPGMREMLSIRLSSSRLRYTRAFSWAPLWT